MKFYNQEYIKHKNCVDAFFAVYNVEDNGKTAKVFGYWYIQGLHNHWCASDYTYITIDESNYSKWNNYNLTTIKRDA